MARPAPPLAPAFTPDGFELDEAAARARFGRHWPQLLRRLTLTAVVPPGAPAAARRNARKHFCYERANGRVALPRRLAAPLRRSGLLGPEAAAAVEPWDPRTGAPCFCGAPYPLRRFPPEAAEMTEPLYEYQEAYIAHLLECRFTPERWAEGAAQAYIHLDTGRGKTRVILALIARLGVPAIVVVPTLQLQSDGVAEAARVFPHLRAVAYSNALAKRRRLDATTADVMFCVVVTASEKPPEFFEGFGCVILDEGHEYCSAVWSRLLRAPVPYFGVASATPLGRPDGLDRVVTRYAGAPLPLDAVVGPGLVESFEFRGRVREVHYTADPAALPPAPPAADGAPASAIVEIGRLVADPCRLRLVAAEVEQLLRLHETLPPAERAAWGLGLDERGVLRRHSVIVFAEHRDYLPALRRLLEARGCADILVEDEEADAPAGAAAGADAPAPGPAVAGPGVDDGAVILRGGARAEERALAKRVRVVLTTYGYSRRGVSFPQLTAAVLASPRRNGLWQILGRIGRLTPDLSLRSIVRVVVDVRDMASTLRGQSTTRREAYRRKGWPVYRVVVAAADHPDGPPRPAVPPAQEVPLGGRGRRAAPGAAPGAPASADDDIHPLDELAALDPPAALAPAPPALPPPPA